MPRVHPRTVAQNFKNEDLKIFNQERLKDEVSESIYHLMRSQNIQKKELATLLGVSKSRVTKILQGSSNMTLETVADAFMALGRSIHIRLDCIVDDTSLPVRDDAAPEITPWQDEPVLLSVIQNLHDTSPKPPHMWANTG